MTCGRSPPGKAVDNVILDRKRRFKYQGREATLLQLIRLCYLLRRDKEWGIGDVRGACFLPHLSTAKL
jgi:hypothetical protein